MAIQALYTDASMQLDGERIDIAADGSQMNGVSGHAVPQAVDAVVVCSTNESKSLRETKVNFLVN